MVEVLLNVFLVAAIALIGLGYGKANYDIRKEMKKDGQI